VEVVAGVLACQVQLGQSVRIKKQIDLPATTRLRQTCASPPPRLHTLINQHLDWLTHTRTHTHTHAKRQKRSAPTIRRCIQKYGQVCTKSKHSSHRAAYSHTALRVYTTYAGRQPTQGHTPFWAGLAVLPQPFPPCPLLDGAARGRPSAQVGTVDST